VLLQPPGSIIGDDTLLPHARLDAGCQAQIVTPGATRSWRNASGGAVQQGHAPAPEGAPLQ
jgi:urease accessory protein UreH